MRHIRGRRDTCGRLAGGGVTRAADWLIAFICVYMCEYVCKCVYVCEYVCICVYVCISVYMCVTRAADEGGGVTRAADWWGEV